MKKRGQIDLVVILIILVVSGIVISLSAGKIISWMTDKSNTERCLTTVEARANAKQITGIDLFKFPVKCPPSDPIIIKDKSGYENKAKEEIANEMYDCWYKFGEGKLDFLDDDDFGQQNQKCYLCSAIVFDKSLKDKSLVNLDQYLINNGYASYLWGKDYEADKLNIYSNIPMDKSLYVLFVAHKRGQFFDEVKNFFSSTGGQALAVTACYGGAKTGIAFGALASPLGSVIGAGVGCVGGAIIIASTAAAMSNSEYVPLLYLTNSQEINQLCQSSPSYGTKLTQAYQQVDPKYAYPEMMN